MSVYLNANIVEDWRDARGQEEVEDDEDIGVGNQHNQSWDNLTHPDDDVELGSHQIFVFSDLARIFTQP